MLGLGVAESVENSTPTWLMRGLVIRKVRATPKGTGGEETDEQRYRRNMAPQDDVADELWGMAERAREIAKMRPMDPNRHVGWPGDGRSWRIPWSSGAWLATVH